MHYFSEPVSGVIRAKGFNTDADGVARALREDLAVKLEGANVLLLGTGGAGQVAALRLALENVSELFLVDFVNAKAEAVAQEIGRTASAGKGKDRLSAGAGGFVVECHAARFEVRGSLPLGEKQFPLRQARAVYDMIYRPAETTLLKAAKTAGAKRPTGWACCCTRARRLLKSGPDNPRRST